MKTNSILKIAVLFAVILIASCTKDNNDNVGVFTAADIQTSAKLDQATNDLSDIIDDQYFTENPTGKTVSPTEASSLPPCVTVTRTFTLTNWTRRVDFGTAGSGKTFYWDNVVFGGSAVSNAVEIPLNFESTTLSYAFTNFSGGNASVVDNPSKTGINTSSKVGKMIKGAGDPWAGAFITLDNAVDFSAGKTFKVKVYSPRVGAKLLLKLEHLTDPNINFEKEVSTTKANEWEEITFDYSTINAANKYHKVVFIFDLGTIGDGSSNFTFYFDDIKLN